MMRLIPTALAASVLLASSGCAQLEFLTARCPVESITVTWPATITRGSLVTSVLLTGTVSPDNIDQAQFNTLKAGLIDGNTQSAANIIWTVPAFNVNGGYIAFLHRAPLTAGDTHQVNLAFDGGGWGVFSETRALPPTVAVRAENFNATAASGSIVVLSTSPLRLRIDVTTQNTAGETIRLTGDAGFSYNKAISNCS